MLLQECVMSALNSTMLLNRTSTVLSHLDFKQPHLSDVNDIAEQADSFADLSIYMRSLLLPLPLRLLCLVALSIALALLHGAHGANGSEYRIGIGKSDITGPVAEIVLMGYGDPDQKGTGILNRLYETYNSCEVGARDSPCPGGQDRPVWSRRDEL